MDDDHVNNIAPLPPAASFDEAISTLFSDSAHGRSIKERMSDEAGDDRAAVAVSAAPDHPALTTLIDFLETVLPPGGPVYFAAWPDKTKKTPHGRAPMRHVPCSSIPELAKKLLALDGEGKEVYVAMAVYGTERYVRPDGTSGQRIKENVTAVQAFWLDIDAGDGKPYATQAKARAAVDEFASSLGIVPTRIVSSGTGLHVHYSLLEPVAPGEWSPVMQALHRAASQLGFHPDSARKDASSILRAPGTTHRKDPANPRPVAILSQGEPVSFVQFKAAVERVAGPIGAAGSGAGGDALPMRSGVVDNSALSLPRPELDPRLRGLSQEAQLVLLDSACAVIPDAEWADYQWCVEVVASAFVGLVNEHGFDAGLLVDILDRHCARAANYDAAWVREKFYDAQLRGRPIRDVLDPAEQHGWIAAEHVSVPPIEPASCTGAAPLAEPVLPVGNRPTLEGYLMGREVLVTGRGDGQYFNIEQRECRKPGAVNRAYGHLTAPCGKTADAILKEHPRTERVWNVGFHPGEGLFYFENGRRYVNAHVPPPDEIAPTKDEAILFADLWDYAFPQDKVFGRWFLQWLAFAVQHPGIKITSVPLFVGLEGVGKNLLCCDLPTWILGEQNAQIFNNKVLRSDFSGPLARAHHVYLDELKVGGHQNAVDLANAMKALVTDRRVVVHPKGVDHYTLANRILVTASSNFADAMHLSRTDRRYGVYELKPTRGYTPDQHKAFFDKVYGTFDPECSPRGPGVLRYILGRVSLADFNPKGAPPWTAAKMEMVSLSAQRLEEVILDLFESKAFPFDKDIVPVAWVRTALDGRIKGLETTSDQKLGRILQTAPINGEPVGQKRLEVIRTVNIDGFQRLVQLDKSMKHRVQAIRNIELWKDASESVISQYLKTDSPLAVIPGDGAIDEHAAEAP